MHFRPSHLVVLLLASAPACDVAELAPASPTSTEVLSCHLASTRETHRVAGGADARITTTYAYDAEGRTTSISTDHDGDGHSEWVERRRYPDPASVVSEWDQDGDGGIDRRSTRTEHPDHSVLVEDDLGADGVVDMRQWVIAGGLGETLLTTQDGEGRVVGQTLWLVDAEGRLVEQRTFDADGLLTVTEVVWDATGEVSTASLDADLDGVVDEITITRLGADGQPREIGLDDDADGRVDARTTWLDDAQCRPWRVVEDDDGDDRADRTRTSTYGSHGHIDRDVVTDGGGNVVDWIEHTWRCPDEN